MDPKAFILFVNTIANLVLGFIVWFPNRHKERNIVFLLFSSSIALWSFGLAMFYSTSFAPLSLFWAKILYLAGSMIAVSLSYFSFIFPTQSNTGKKDFIRLAHFTSIAVMLMLTLNTDMVLYGVIFAQFKGLMFGSGYALWVLHFGGFMALAFYNLFSKLKNSKGIQAIQLKYILIGTLSAALFGGATNIVLPTFGIFSLFNIGPLMTISMAGLIAYAIIKHRFMDIRFIVARTVSFSLLIMLTAFVYSLLMVFLFSIFTGLNLDNVTLSISAILVLIMGFTIQPLRRVIEKMTDSVLYKDRYDSGKLLYNLALRMSSTIELKELLHLLLQNLITDLRISHGTFFLLEDQKIAEVVHEGMNSKVIYSEFSILSLINENRMLIYDELQPGVLSEIMNRSDYALVLPLYTRSETIGILALGNKLSGDMYTASDIQVLETFAPEAAVAIANAKAYKKINQFNITLREEVQKATGELRQANEHLKELDKLKDDFVSVASHELRTPMTAIKSYLWMALAGQGGPLSDKLKYYLQRSYSSVDRLIKLVNDMLNISRIDSGRLTLQIEKSDIIKIVREVVDDITPRADELGIKIAIENPGSIPDVIIDPDKIKEVIYNLVGNSLKFTQRDGKITISFNQDNESVEINIADTGSGIAAEDLSKLFQKFGILPGTYVTNQPTFGTGLGLYICKSLIEMHDGKIWAKSEGKGKGAVFSFTVKKYSQNELEVFSQKFKNNREISVGLIHSQI